MDSPQATSTPSSPNDGIIYNVLETFNAPDNTTRYLVQTNEGKMYYGHVLRGTTFHRHVIHPSKAFLEIKVRRLKEYAPIEIDADAFFPCYDPETMTRFTGDIDDTTVFPKKQVMLKYMLFTRSDDSETHRMLVKQEITRCEKIERHGAHPALAKYLGVQVDRFSRVKAVVYKRYTVDLWDFTYFPLEKNQLMRHHVPIIMDAVERGMRHLHGLGIVHCDVRPVNIFLVTTPVKKAGSKKEKYPPVTFDEVVLGDFDAAVEYGDTLYMKTHGESWWPANHTRSSPATPGIDNYALEKLGEWLDREASDRCDCGCSLARIEGA